MMFLVKLDCMFNQLLRMNLKMDILKLRYYSSDINSDVERIVRIINDHPFPDVPLHPTLQREIATGSMSSTFVEKTLGRLFAAHSNGLKAYELFKHCLKNEAYIPSSDAFEKTLHILTRMRYFDQAWELMERITRGHSSLLTLKSMSIVLSRIAKFQSYEETLEAFDKMEMEIFTEKKFGTNEFNVLLRAFCTQRQMKEARSVFNKMHSRFSPNTKTMNILLLGFKESGDVTAVELFYHEMIRRGFKPNNITYNIRIDAYCKKGHFGDALRLFEEMERANLTPTLETITTLVHGAGLARNITKARQLFDSIHNRNLCPDSGAYNALLSALVRSKDLISAAALMDEMERSVEHDNVTYHTMFFGLMRQKGIGPVTNLYTKMVEKNFVPKTRTVVMLMKFFCENGEVDLGLELWNYLVKKGHCPHTHALDLLVTGLCARQRVGKAFNCSRQMLERGSRHVSELVFRMLERLLVQTEDLDKLKELESMTDKLKLSLPPLKERYIRISPLINQMITL